MANVKLLLKESIKNVGRVGDIVEVSPGFARNYLLPKDLAVQPTAGNVKKVEARVSQLIAEEMTLQQIRRARKLTQQKIAKSLHTLAYVPYERVWRCPASGPQRPAG